MASGITVLHVEDEPSFSELTATFLERENDQFTVETAVRAEEGLRMIHDRQPDCVVSDYNMPGMDGLEFLQAVRVEYPDLPFILFTGKGSEAVASEAIATDVTDYLQKQGGAEQYELLANRIHNAVQARREAERADRQDQLMRLTEYAGDTGGFEVETETGGVLLTDGAHRILNVPEGETPSFEDGLEYYHPDDREEIRQAIQRALRTDEQTHGTWRYQHPDGEKKLLDVTYTPRTTEEDTTTIRGAIHDVTERRERQRELKQTRDLMANMEQLADAGAWEYDSETEQLMITDGTRRLYGLDEDADLTLKAAFDAIHPDDRDLLTDRFNACLESGEPYQVDVRFTTGDGSYQWVTARGERVNTHESGHVVRGYIRDITDKITRERRLTELNKATQGLLRAETRREVADIGVEAAGDVLDLQANAVHFSEADDTRLVPVARTDKVASLIGDPQSLPVADSIAGRVYRNGEPAAIDDVRQDPDVHDADTDLRGHLYLPLADHGILIAGSEEQAAFDQQDLVLGELLAGNLVAALNRVERERTARQQREQLSLFFEESPLGAIRWDDEFRFERMNRRAEELLGYDEAELRNAPWETIVDDGDRDTVGDVVESLLDADGGTHVLNRNVRKDGEMITCEWHNRVVTDGDGSVRAIFSKFQDITEQENRKRELRDLKAQYQTLIENLPDGAVFLYDTDVRVVRAGGTELSAVGLSSDEVEGETPYDRYPPEIAGELADNIEAALDGESTTFDQAYQGKDYRIQTVPVRIDGGEITHAMAVSKNVTERRERMRELNRERQRYTTLFETLPNPVLHAGVEDGEPVVRMVNPAFEETFGYDSETITGERLHDHVLPDDRTEPADQLNQRVLIEGDVRTEVRRETTDGVRTFRVNIRANDAENGSPEGYAVYTDITEREEREQELEQQNEQLGEFANIVSHDLRGPLAVAKNYLELARETGESDPLAKAADAIDRSQALIDDLLTLARKGDQVDDAEPVVLAEVAESSWRTVETPRATLDAGGPAVIEADRSRLRELFENLYRNSVEHGSTSSRTESGDGVEHGGDEVVAVSVGAMDGGFYVADTGPGIPESEREEIFEAGHSTTGDGTGFGLRIVERIAEAHGWEITVTESEQDGARFEFTGVERPN